MMLCSYEKLLEALKSNPNIKFLADTPIPNCPKNADVVCANAAGRCSIGNKKSCEQKLVFYFKEKSIFYLTVIFTAKPDTKIGYIRNTNSHIARMLKNEIISPLDLQAIEV